VLITYFVHDLADPAVGRRVTMLRRGGKDVRVYGFRRTHEPVSSVAGVAVRNLGRTIDAGMFSRAVSVLLRCFTAPLWARSLVGSEVLVARNLEMLAIAVTVRSFHAPRARLVYELLDVHRLLARDGWVATALRSLEGWLLCRCTGIIVSSPAFEEFYLRRHHQALPPILTVENKVMPNDQPLSSSEIEEASSQAPAMGPPWRIGWFGVIRCQRSLDALSSLARRYPGLVEIDIRGKVGVNIAASFDSIIAATPGIRYHGPYQYPDDLTKIYRKVHFTWAVDFYEAGLNSKWLLPNRLYEGGYCQAVPIALGGVETGRWLKRQRLGLLLEDSWEASLEDQLTEMTPAGFMAAAAAMRQAAPSLFAWTGEDCGEVVRWIEEVGTTSVAAVVGFGS
jgi:succinoglycan biosynthesis protein ExoL